MNKKNIILISIVYIFYLALSYYYAKPNNYLDINCNSNNTAITNKNYTKYNITQVCECSEAIKNIYIYITLESLVGIVTMLYVIYAITRVNFYQCMFMSIVIYLGINITYGSFCVTALYNNNCNKIIRYYDSYFYYDFITFYIHILIAVLFIAVECIMFYRKPEYLSIQDNSYNVEQPPPYSV